MSAGSGSIKFREIDLDVEYESEAYFPQTHEHPAEGGEFYITAVYVGGIDIIELIQDSTLDQITEEYLKKFSN